MIVRIVKMEFKKEHVSDFKNLFDNKKEKIRAFPGCQYLELLQGTDAKETIFMTYSHWKSPEDLENYRYSDLFKETWAETKAMFSKKAEAISTHRLHKLK
jgi:heme-degrading monooxygenase HmoA